jgi:hypothetical protein
MNKLEYIIINANYITKNKEDKIPLLEEYDEECYNGIAEKELYSRKEVESLLTKILSNSIPLEQEIEKAYEAGKLDKEYSLSFDNVIGRYLSCLKLDI